jgi:branched-chain amino acid transport system ATP-binding protein
MTLLDVSGVTRTFGGLTAVDAVDLTIEAGEIVGLIGPNGAGKTTLFDCITGILPIDGGTVRFDGEDVTEDPVHELAQKGLVRTYQLTRVLGNMTVRENLLLGALDQPGESAWGAIRRSPEVRAREAAVAERAEEQLERFDLAPVADEYASDISGGQRKLLELGRILMNDPRLVLLDEPFAGINPTLERAILDHVRTLNDQGTTFLVIEHDVEQLARLVDRLVVLNQGEVIADDDPDAILRDETVISAYLGEAVDR